MKSGNEKTRGEIRGRPIFGVTRFSKTICHGGKYPMPYHYEQFGLWDRMRHDIVHIEDIHVLEILDEYVEKLEDDQE